MSYLLLHHLSDYLVIGEILLKALKRSSEDGKDLFYKKFWNNKLLAKYITKPEIYVYAYEMNRYIPSRYM